VDVTLAYGYHEDRTPTHGYEATREAAMAAFAKSWAARIAACIGEPGGERAGTLLGRHAVTGKLFLAKVLPVGLLPEVSAAGERQPALLDLEEICSLKLVGSGIGDTSSLGCKPIALEYLAEFGLDMTALPSVCVCRARNFSADWQEREPDDCDGRHT
jgi:hypothetical protein